jgi:putative transposase
MRYAFLRTHTRDWSVQVMCQVLDVARSGYYAWCRRPPSAQTQANRLLQVHVHAGHRRSRGTYGSRRVQATLQRQGQSCGRHRVRRLMRTAQLHGRPRRRFRVTTTSHHRLPVAPNRLLTAPAVTRANQVWVGDITYLRTHEGWLYLAAVLDLWSRRIVGWATSARLTRHVVRQALTMATQRRTVRPGLLIHSDQGSQYAAWDHRRLVQHVGAISSMSRRGNCYDNATMESWFHTLKTELVDRHIYPTRAAATTAVFAYIARWYNRHRLHSSLGYRSPVEYEAITQPRA